MYLTFDEILGRVLPWSRLGIRGPAGREETRRAYLAACVRHHPDRGGDLETMQGITSAWDEIKRAMLW